MVLRLRDVALQYRAAERGIGLFEQRAKLKGGR